ncbi:HEAT repeat domain-containing protein [Halobacteria archaeon AArc-xg1-1]|uniref:HEAT repeat domain-containing protein n=2 Tax=Natronoglomus mannanivorans TaxID=2979990 RepID=A0AAP3E442_9EURY|nr:HEAT repeat domain-containing protein [Halobacteria archaeon AArc-xg1-1]
MTRELATGNMRKQRDFSRDSDSELIPDGGFPSIAGISPVNANHLRAFLHEYADAPGFEITYEDEDEGEGETVSRLLFELAIIEPTVEIEGRTPAVRCKPVAPAPAPETVTVPLDAIEFLSVVEPPEPVYTATAETATEEALVLRRLADANPDTVRVSSLIALLDREDTGPQREALRALHLLAGVRPADCTPALPVLRSLLQRTAFSNARPALAVLYHVGTEEPANIAPMVDEIAPYSTNSDWLTREKALECIAAVADHDPADVRDIAPTLATLIETETRGRRHAIYILLRLARASPERTKPFAKTLGRAITDGSLSNAARLNATVALGQIVGDDPSVGVPLLGDIVELFEVDDIELRNNAVALVNEIATVHTDVVEQYRPELHELMTIEDDYTRINASATLARIAGDFPDTVTESTPVFVQLLEDDHPRVRENACWGLGSFRATDAENALRACSRRDDDPDVRTRAEWALSRLE